MEKYEAIESYIHKAHIQRSVYLADLISDVLVDSWKGIKYAADVLFSVARAKTGKGVFTFDA